MELQIYHFLRYDKQTLRDYYFRCYSPHSFVCFDLEDSIQDIRNPANTSRRKKHSRDALEFVIHSNIEIMKNLNIAIRLNPLKSTAFNKDTAMLVKLKGQLEKLTLFLPKTENPTDITTLREILDLMKIPFTEIIAVIESKNGMENLQSILNMRSEKFYKIAYGHCDYNYSLGVFPFKHHHSSQYWNVVDNMIQQSETQGFTYINSPCLNLDDNYIFESMLRRLTGNKTSKTIGQIVLTHKQAAWCNRFAIEKDINVLSQRKIRENFAAEERTYDEDAIKGYAKNLISAYEANVNGKAFSIAGINRVLISPHEYLAAKRYLNE